MNQPTPEQFAEFVDAATTVIQSWESMRWGNLLSGIGRLKTLLKGMGVSL